MYFLSVGEAFVAPILEAHDHNGSVNVTYDDSLVDVNTEGTYIVTYTATNEIGTTYYYLTVEVVGSGGSSSYSEYYKTLEGLTGEAFKVQLQNIITTFENSTNPNYTTSYTSANDSLQDADEDLTNPNNIILIYNSASIPSPWDSAATWNKEHVWAKSLLIYPTGGLADTKTNGPGADLHNLRAANPSINSSRGNKPFVDGSGSYGAVGSGWYPGDDHIGDVARIILYMNLRWGDSLANINDIGTLSLFLEWHLLDPVDDFERHRNEVIYSYQGNRNPFIDYPEFVSMIWGTTPSATYEPFTSQSNVLLTNIIQDDIVMYDNRSSMYIN